MTLSPTAIHDLGTGVLGCICAALDQYAATPEGQAAGYPGCPCMKCLVPGQAAMDWCAADCGTSCPGELHVGLRRLYPAGAPTFPRPFTEVRHGTACPPLVTAAEFTISLFRCAPMSADDGTPPSCEELDHSARILHADAALITQALSCCVPLLTTPGSARLRYVVGETRIVGPQGGCVGVEANLTVALGGCRCDV